jgi:Na+/phosphate symporter
MRIILSRSVYSLIVYISCIMQHVNNTLIVSKKITKICARVTRDPVLGFCVGIAFTRQKWVWNIV